MKMAVEKSCFDCCYYYLLSHEYAHAFEWAEEREGEREKQKIPICHSKCVRFRNSQYSIRFNPDLLLCECVFCLQNFLFIFLGVLFVLHNFQFKINSKLLFYFRQYQYIYLSLSACTCIYSRSAPER